LLVASAKLRSIKGWRRRELAYANQARALDLRVSNASPEKISIQVITLIALSRLIAMETKQSKRKEQQ
jgi:hypothetical protein